MTDITIFRAEVEKLRSALKKAKDGLDAGVKHYAERDMYGNVIPGDEQYPWVKAMQIGLDASSAALTQETSMSDIVEKLYMSPDKDEIITALNEVIREQQDKIEHLTAEMKRLTGERDKWGQKYNELLEQHAVTVSQITTAVWAAFAGECKLLTAENEKLRAALCPLADVFLYPDDLGFEASSDIKEDLDWDDDANDMNTENVFVLRRDIRRARAALGEERT